MKHRDAAPTNGTYDEVLTTGEIFATIPSGFQVRAKNGPFQSRESADYALDVAWEAPDSDD